MYINLNKCFLSNLSMQKLQHFGKKLCVVDFLVVVDTNGKNELPYIHSFDLPLSFETGKTSR